MGLLKASLTGMTGNLSTLSFLFLYGKLYCEKELTLNDGDLYPARIPIKICSSPFLRVICQFQTIWCTTSGTGSSYFEGKIRARPGWLSASDLTQLSLSPVRLNSSTWHRTARPQAEGTQAHRGDSWFLFNFTFSIY